MGARFGASIGRFDVGQGETMGDVVGAGDWASQECFSDPVMFAY